MTRMIADLALLWLSVAGLVAGLWLAAWLALR